MKLRLWMYIKFLNIFFVEVSLLTVFFAIILLATFLELYCILSFVESLECREVCEMYRLIRI